jgi:glutamate/tyrosine decarboxylase-like PLP-dependent enzyme
VHAENEVLRWLADEFGLPASPAASSCRAARSATSPPSSRREAARDRLEAAGRPARPLAGRLQLAAHSSIASAARVMDVDVVGVPVGDDGTLRGDAVARCSTSTASVFAVVATAGSTNFGIVDDIASIADAVAGAWLHVDGAYGLAACSPPPRGTASPASSGRLGRRRPAQVAVRPFDACALIYRDPELGRRAHAARRIPRHPHRDQ